MGLTVSIHGQRTTAHIFTVFSVCPLVKCILGRVCKEYPPTQMLVLSAVQPVMGDNKEVLVFSNNSGGLLFRVYQNNDTPTGNTEADDHLHYGARARWDSLLHGLPGHKVDVGARPKE